MRSPNAIVIGCVSSGAITALTLARLAPFAGLSVSPGTSNPALVAEGRATIAVNEYGAHLPARSIG